jgi:hypothetical protein
VLLAFYQQYRSSRADQEKDKRTDFVQQLILGQLNSLHAQAPPQPVAPKTPAKPTEATRRKSILASLRNEYILSHKVISPGLLAGTEQPPNTWVNTRLKELGEHWTVSREHPLTVSRTEVMPYSVGKPVQARIHLSNLEAPVKVKASFVRGFKTNFYEQYEARKMLEDSMWSQAEEQALNNHPQPLDVPITADTYIVVESQDPLTQVQEDGLKSNLTFYVMEIIETDDGSPRIERCFFTSRDTREHPTDPVSLTLCIEHNN